MIPKPNSGRKPIYDFASLIAGGAPLEVPISKKDHPKKSIKIASAAREWAKRNGAKMVTRVTGLPDVPLLSIFRVK